MNKRFWILCVSVAALAGCGHPDKPVSATVRKPQFQTSSPYSLGDILGCLYPAAVSRSGEEWRCVKDGVEFVVSQTTVNEVEMDAAVNAEIIVDLAFTPAPGAAARPFALCALFGSDDGKPALLGAVTLEPDDEYEIINLSPQDNQSELLVKRVDGIDLYRRHDRELKRIFTYTYDRPESRPQICFRNIAEVDGVDGFWEISVLPADRNQEVFSWNGRQYVSSGAVEEEMHVN